MAKTKRQTEEVFAEVTLYCPVCTAVLGRIPPQLLEAQSWTCPDSSCGTVSRVKITARGRGRAKRFEAEYEWEA